MKDTTATSVYSEVPGTPHYDKFFGNLDKLHQGYIGIDALRISDSLPVVATIQQEGYNSGNYYALTEGGETALRQFFDSNGILGVDESAFSVSAKPDWMENPFPVTPPAEHAVTAAFRALHNAGKQLEKFMDAQEGGFRNAVIVKAKDTLVAVREFSYLLAHSTDYTQAEKIAYCAEVPNGPVNLRVSGQDFEPVVLAWLQMLRAGTISPPTQPSSWVNPGNATAVSLTSMVTIAGTIPDGTNLASGGWLDSYTPPADPADPAR